MIKGDRRLISISLNKEQQAELNCAMSHMGTDSPTALYRILVKRYLRENRLVPGIEDESEVKEEFI